MCHFETMDEVGKISMKEINGGHARVGDHPHRKVNPHRYVQSRPDENLVRWYLVAILANCHSPIDLFHLQANLRRGPSTIPIIAKLSNRCIEYIFVGIKRYLMLIQPKQMIDAIQVQ